MKNHPLVDQLSLGDRILQDIGNTEAKPNRQLFKNSDASKSATSRMYSEDVQNGSNDVFHNSKDPNLAILHEKPEHRIIVFLKAQGKNNKEVAEITGFTQSWISQICRQPWFKRSLMSEIQSAGRDAVDIILKGEVVDSLNTLIEIRDTDEEKGAVRCAAANSLLDRYLGKPTQRVETMKVASSDEVIRASASELEQRIRDLRIQNGLNPN